MHADLGRVHDPGAALLGPDWHVGAHGGGLRRDPLEGEDLRLGAAGRHGGAEGEALLNGEGHAVGPGVHSLGFLLSLFRVSVCARSQIDLPENFQVPSFKGVLLQQCALLGSSLMTDYCCCSNEKTPKN